MVNKPNSPPSEGSANDNPANQGKQYDSGTATSGSQGQNLEELVDRVLEQKLIVEETNRLRNRVGWLTGILVVAILLLGGGFAWLAYRSQAQQEQLAEITSETASSVDSQRIQELESQIQEIQKSRQPFPEPVTTQIETNQERIRELENQLNEVTTTVNDNQQTLKDLSETLREMSMRQPESTLSPSPSGSNSDGTETSTPSGSNE